MIYCFLRFDKKKTVMNYSVWLVTLRDRKATMLKKKNVQ